MGKWKTVRLGDYVNIINGYAFQSKDYIEDGYRIIRITNVQKAFIVDNNPEYYPHSPALDKFELYDKDLLISLTGNVGRVGLINRSLLPAYLNQRVACLRIKNNHLLKNYLFSFLNTELFERSCIESSNGIAQKNMSTEWLKEYIIPLPPIEIQKEIAEVLERASKLIEKRKAQIKKLDLLVKSQFIEMFGDPVTNPRGWQQMTFKQASIRLSDGPFGSNLKSEHYAPSGVRVIRLQNIGVGVFIDNDKAFVPQTHYEKIKKYTCKSGDIVIGTLGEPNLRACIIPESIDVAINKADCVHYIPKPELLTNEFVCQYINCPATLTLASGMIHGQTRARVSSGQIAEMPLYIPPLDLQNQFSTFVNQVDKSKFALQQSLDMLETNYKSLMQKCFRGDLF